MFQRSMLEIYSVLELWFSVAALFLYDHLACCLLSISGFFVVLFLNEVAYTKRLFEILSLDCDVQQNRHQKQWTVLLLARDFFLLP